MESTEYLEELNAESSLSDGELHDEKNSPAHESDLSKQTYSLSNQDASQSEVSNIL